MLEYASMALIPFIGVSVMNTKDKMILAKEIPVKSQILPA